MEGKELDRKIKELYNTLKVKLSDEQKENTHFKSASNFVYHLVDRPRINPKGSPKLQEINEPKIKKELLEYLEVINNKEFTDEESFNLLYERIYKIGSFMGTYYNFSMLGFLSNFFQILISLTIGAILDVIRFFVTDNPFPILTLTFLIIFLLRLFIKRKQRRVFGVNY